MPPLTHIVGAGLAGLSAAVRLAEKGLPVAVYETAGQAGGRCRSYYDAAFGAVIDNGNHLVLSGNDRALSYASLIGGAEKLIGPAHAHFDFADVKTGERWSLKLNDGRFPVWFFHKSRRVPDTRPADYLKAASLLFAGRSATVTDVLGDHGALYERLWHPLILSALNTDPREASAKLAGAIMRNTLAKGGAACRPLIAEGLSSVFIDPAVCYIERQGGTVAFNQRLRSVVIEDGRATTLDFGTGREMDIAPGDTIILAVPPWIATDLLPGLKAPDEFRAIVNGHFRVAPPPHFPKIMGVINGTVEWIFAFPDRLSITISGADRLNDRPREQLAAELWQDVSAVTGLSPELPHWQIVKEKRATFAALPHIDAKRPGAQTTWSNIFLAGDWTKTGLPATIEGAIRSGETAAHLARGYRRRWEKHNLQTGRTLRVTSPASKF